MFGIDTAEIDQLTDDLKKLSKKALPYAVRNTLNDVAFVVTDRSKQIAAKKMVMRNKWTLGSIRARKTGGTNIDKMVSRTGSMQKYMADQEMGSTKRAGGKYGVPIPTSWAAGQEGATPRTRAIRRANRMGSISLQRPGGVGVMSSAARLMYTVHTAIRTGQRYQYLAFRGGKGKGIYKIIGGRRNSKGGWPTGAKLKLVQSLQHKTVPIPKNPWLEPAVDYGYDKIGEMYVERLVDQIKRNRLFFRKR